MSIRILLFLFALLFMVSLIQPSLSIESAESQFFVQISPEVTTPGQNISVTISVISKQNMTNSIWLNIVTPDGVLYRSNLILQDSGDGFVTRTLVYPPSFNAASTVRQGNYSVFIQNSTGHLIAVSSFKVIDSVSEERWNFFKTSFVPYFIFPGILGAVTYLYQRMGAKRDKQKDERQKCLEIQRENRQKKIERNREDHKHELTIKSEIIKNISVSYSDTIGKLYLLLNDTTELTTRKTTLDSDLFRTVFSTKSTVTSLLKAYFKNDSLVKKWEDFSHNTTRLWGIYDRLYLGKTIADSDVTSVKNYLNDQNDEINWDNFKKHDLDTMIEVYNLANKILFEYKSQIIGAVLNEKISTLNLQIDDDTSKERNQE